MTDARAALEEAWREHWGRLVALVVAQHGRPDLAEDAVADAFAAAARRWPDDGVPGNPAAWLLTTARNRVRDRLRTEAVHARREPLMVVDARTRAAASLDPADPSDTADVDAVPDERLRLVLACCHPALAPEARVALTLRLVVGLSTEEIARLTLTSPATTAARVTRAKKRLAGAGIPFTIPSRDVLPARLDAVARVLYLVLTAGYQPATTPLGTRVDLADEAVRLTRLVDALLPGRPVVRALLALELLQHSRRRARVDADGGLVLLPDQDRSLWDADDVAEGLALVDTLPPSDGLAEELRLQALVAAEHARAPSAAETRWPRIADLYGRLEALTGSPVVRVVRAVAVAEASGPAAGLALLDGLDDVLAGYHRLHVARGELLARAGRADDAVAELRLATTLAPDGPEHRHLVGRLQELAGPAPHHAVHRRSTSANASSSSP